MHHALTIDQLAKELILIAGLDSVAHDFWLRVGSISSSGLLFLSPYFSFYASVHHALTIHQLARELISIAGLDSVAHDFWLGVWPISP